MRALVFGGTGALGSAIVDRLGRDGWSALVASRTPGSDVDLSDSEWSSKLADGDPLDAVVWAQGVNMNGAAPDVGADDMRRAFEANVVFITESLGLLSAVDAIASPARLVLISSVWQIAARPNKLAYVTSKAALGGLVPALAADLAGRGIAVNGVLPGVIDTPMTRSQLSAEQVIGVESSTPGRALATPDDVARTAAWLAGPESHGVNAQWIAVDNGWTAVRHV